MSTNGRTRTSVLAVGTVLTVITATAAGEQGFLAAPASTKGIDRGGGSGTDGNENCVADECDIASGLGDCDLDGVPNPCEIDANGNGMPDECELASGFPAVVSENTTGFPDWFFTGAPDPVSAGVAGRRVTVDFGATRFFRDRPGPDLSGVEGGGPEF